MQAFFATTNVEHIQVPREHHHIQANTSSLATTHVLITNSPSQLSVVESRVPIAMIPIEIWERVIDVAANFWDSLDFLSQPRRITLRSYALTCRVWHPRFRYYLFYTSDLLQNADHLSGYVCMLRAHPDLTSFVRQLRISGSFDGAKAHWINALPISLLPLLTNLNHIIFTAQVSNRLAPFHPLFYQALSMFKAVTEVHYACHTRQPFDEFARFVMAFRNLKKLHVDGESVWENHATGELLTRPFSSTKRLQLQYLHLSPYLLQRNMINVLGFIRQHVDMSSMRRLEVWDVRWRDGDVEALHAIDDLLKASQYLRSVLLHMTLLGINTLDLSELTGPIRPCCVVHCHWI